MRRAYTDIPFHKDIRCFINKRIVASRNHNCVFNILKASEQPYFNLFTCLKAFTVLRYGKYAVCLCKAGDYTCTS